MRCAVIRVIIISTPLAVLRDLLKKVCITEIYPQLGNIIVVNPKIEGETAVTGEIRDGHTSGRAIGQRDSLTECSAVYIGRGAVLRVESPAITGAVVVVAIEVLEAEGVWVICHQFIICGVVAQVQTGDLRSCERGAVAAVLELVVVDVGYIAGLLTIVVIRGIKSIIDGNKGRGILDIYQVVFVSAIVDRDIITAVILIVISLTGIIVIFVGFGAHRRDFTAMTKSSTVS